MNSTIALTLLLIVLFCSCTSCDKSNDDNLSSPYTQGLFKLPKTEMQLAGETFTIELAYLRATRSHGMMYRNQLPRNAGMLFIFPEARPRSFYMKNCLIDLDIIFMDENGRVVTTATMRAPTPGRELTYYESIHPAQYALELPAGRIKELGIKPGAVIDLPPAALSVTPEPD